MKDSNLRPSGYEPDSLTTDVTRDKYFMQNCVNINLHIHPLRSDINPDLISLLQSLSLKITHAELFYSGIFHFTPIHTDYFGGDYVKLNYVFGGRNSLMHWWKQKPNISKVGAVTPLNTNYINYLQDEVEQIDSQPVNFPSIVQVCIPHNVKNYEEPRYCLSLVLCKQDNTRPTMAESIELFKDYLY